MRDLFQRFWRHLFSRRPLVPYNYGSPDAPSLRKGDSVYTRLEENAYDFIAGFCGMDGTIKAGSTHKWKVAEVTPNGGVLCVRGDNRVLLNHLDWSDGNRVVVAGNLVRSRMSFRFFTKATSRGDERARHETTRIG